jgi:MEMO1 family protein
MSSIPTPETAESDSASQNRGSKNMGVRKAEKAGTWYPGDINSLTALCKQCLGDEARDPVHGTAVAGIVPHAGLLFSGPIAARTMVAFKPAMPDTIIIFGAVHTMPLSQPAVWTEGSWDSPFGPVEVDQDLAQALVAAGIGEADESPHLGDNAIELQIPLIKYIFPEAKIVPIAVPPLEGIEEIGKLAWEVVSKLERKAVAIGSTDLTHYGDSFSFTPAGYGEEALTWALNNDQDLIDAMLKLNAEAVVSIARRDHSACGAGAAAALTAFARAAGAQGTLLEHTTSHHIRPEGEARHFVDYAGIVFTCN